MSRITCLSARVAFLAFTACIGMIILPRLIHAARAMPQSVQPTALTHANRLIAPEAVSVTHAPSVELQAVATEDEQRELAGLPPRFAISNPVLITPETEGIWENVDGDTEVWRLRVSSPGALSLNLGFRHYFMPEGGQLLIYSLDFAHVMRPFTAQDNSDHGELWTAVVLSDEIIVEVTIPTAARDELRLELTSVNVGYRGFDKFVGEKSGTCNIDVVCSEGDDWSNEIDSAGVFSTGGALLCSGFMINNTAQDQTPYFQTADHCGIDSNNAASVVVYWNYETSSCGGTPDGSLDDFQTGSYFRAGYMPTD